MQLTDAELVTEIIDDAPPAPALTASQVRCAVCGWVYVDGAFACCPRYLSHPKTAAVIKKCMDRIRAGRESAQ